MGVRVYVADHRPLFRDGIVRAVECCGLEVVGVAGDGAAALAGIRAGRPDVAVVDAELSGVSGIELLTQLQGDPPVPAVVLLGDGAAAYPAVAAGARAVISKDADAEDVCDTVQAVARGDTVLDGRAQAALAAEVRAQATRGTRLALSDRERDVLRLVAEGGSTMEIGRRLHLSSSTVKTHLASAYRKLGVSERAAAVAEAMRRNLLN
jgi:two-component system nitrate/nitrite response regulator NarL